MVIGDTLFVCRKEDDRQNVDIYAEKYSIQHMSTEYIYSEEYMYYYIVQAGWPKVKKGGRAAIKN
jgi:hypothetical protein